MNILNKKYVRRLGLRNMKAAKGRNIIAVIAIALTALLFTALFTIIGSISYSFQQSNFRQVGTYAHGAFKRLSHEQCETLKNDEEIKKYGIRRVAGIVSGDAFIKHNTEVSYCDENNADFMYLFPVSGRLPEENTNELATDRKVLSLLGAKGELGEEITLTIDVDGTEVTESFTLCGIWEYDGALPVSHILVSESMADEIVSANTSPYLDENIGSYTLDVMLKSDRDIQETLIEILDRNGYSERYNDIGVNWGYISESVGSLYDSGSIAAIAAFLLIIVATGYLIIFNIFRISVANDIRNYGLLKTIGTTGKQIRSIVFTQVLSLSVIGIPIGLALGWLVGAVLAPVVINELNVHNEGVSSNPVIFAASAVFALITVAVSCLKPAKIAARVSPVEAVRYTESNGKVTIRKSSKVVSVFGMAMANLTRSRSKTVLTVASLAFSLVLFSLCFSFANSFDTEKYLSNISSDFVVSSPEYFNASYTWEADKAMSYDDIAAVTSVDGVESFFTCYGSDHRDTPEALYTEEQLRDIYSRFGVIDEASFSQTLSLLEKRGELYVNITQILGVEKSGFPKIKVFEGELDKLTEDGYIAVENSGNFKVGDNLTLIFTDSIKYINNTTGEETDDINFAIYNDWSDISVEKETHEKNYTICATVDLPYFLGYRYTTTADVFIMESGNFISNIEEAAPLYTAIDVTDEYEDAAEKFMKSYTDGFTLGYSSRVTAAEEFESFRRMFLILGSALSAIVGLIGLLNFINTILTGIFSRKREFSVLRSIGMTGRQLKATLIYEGVFYTVAAIASGLALSLLTVPLSSVIEEIFWFCNYRFNALPFLIAAPLFIASGIIIPLITYRLFSRKTVVERLRESE